MRKLTKAQLALALKFSELIGMEFTYTTRDMRAGIPIAEMYHAIKYGTKQDFYKIECSESYLDRYWEYKNNDKHRNFNAKIVEGYKAMKTSYRNGLRNMGEFI